MFFTLLDVGMNRSCPANTNAYLWIHSGPAHHIIRHVNTNLSFKSNYCLFHTPRSLEFDQKGVSIGFRYFRGFLLSGMSMSVQRWSSCCTLSDDTHNSNRGIVARGHTRRRWPLGVLSCHYGMVVYTGTNTAVYEYKFESHPVRKHRCRQ